MIIVYVPVLFYIKCVVFIFFVFSAFDDVIRNDETCYVNLWLYVNKMK